MDALLTPPESSVDQAHLALYERKNHGNTSIPGHQRQLSYSHNNTAACIQCAVSPSQHDASAQLCSCGKDANDNLSPANVATDSHSPLDSRPSADSLNWLRDENLSGADFESIAALPDVLRNHPLGLSKEGPSTDSGRGTLGKHSRNERYDADAGRDHEAKHKRRRLDAACPAVPPIDVTTGNPGSYSFPVVAIFFTGPSRINEHVYQYILEAFHRFCGMHTAFPPPFETDIFPSLDAINHMIHLYITHIQPLLPILHLPTLDLNRLHWILPLALATSGATFLKHPQSRQLVVSMQELLRRAIITLSNFETGMHSRSDELCLAQAHLLRCISGFYSGNDTLRKSAFNARSAMCAFCQNSWALPQYIDEDRPEGHDASYWLQWTFNESVRRTGFAVWLLDGMISYHFDTTPLLSLENAKVPLPCPEILFEANSAHEWIVLSKLATPMPSLINATELLYSNKHVSIIMGEYSRVLLMHAVLHRTWEVERYARQPLSHYIPAFIDKKRPPPVSDSRDRWLSGKVLVDGWQSAACESLEILHLDAKACANAQNKEHPTILHLHVARITLLAPCQSIQKLALHTAGITYFASAAEETKCRDQIKDWVARSPNSWKLRLSTIHAGSLFWHIRRYSANGFYEPGAVYLATLILWIFATRKSAGDATQSPTAPDSSGDEARQSSIINLDRPLDDELVQEYVLHGDFMHAFIGGVGDLSEQGSMLRVADRGLNLLRELTTWGCSWKYIEVLVRLADRSAVS